MVVKQFRLASASPGVLADSTHSATPRSLA